MTLKSIFTSGMRLSDVLRLSMEKSAFDKTPYTFLPKGALDSIVNKATILIAMGITKPTPEDYDLVAYILMKAKKLFATAAYIGLRPNTLYRAMVLFRNNNFSDERLPLEEMSAAKFVKDVMSGHKHPLAKLEGHVKYEADRIWTFRRVHAFLEEQFRFLAPILSTGQSDQNFGNLILPFVKKHAAQAEGAFGVIDKYEIHSDHVEIPAEQRVIPSNVCAVKEFKLHRGTHQEVAQRWASEVKALTTMNTLNQDHIVRFISAFRRGTPEAPEHYLITEWADGGNLHDLWKSIPNPPLTESFVRAAIKQLRGLSDALCAVHYLRSDGVHTAAHGRHGDLKPENILCFRSGDKIGTLKIGDFGEAKSHQIVTAMRNSNTTARYGTRRYEPPECEIGIDTAHPGQRDMRRSRLYDIWSFGCITLEIIIWLLHGTKGLREFNESVKTGFDDESPFYQVIQTPRIRSARVHSVVALWMKHISKDPACRAGTTALGDLLELVERGLLVVKLPSNGGSVPTDDLLMQTEKHSDYSMPNHSPHQKKSPFQTRFEEIPMINVTPPHRDSANSPGMQAESVIGGPVRYRADELRDRLKLIESKHAEDGYWSTQRKLPLPVVNLDLCSMSTSHSDDEDQSELNGDCSVPKRLHTKEHNKVDRTSAARVDHDQPEAFLDDQARKARDNDDDEVHFTTRGRPRGSKNKRTAQMTRDSTKTSSSTSSCSQLSKPKRSRIDREDDDDHGEQDDKKRSMQRRNSKGSHATCNLACPFAKYLPVEYPQCRKRTAQFRDNAKVKEHLRYEDSEDLVFSLIDQAYGSAGFSLRVFQAYRQNQRAESTCSARAALHCGWTTTSTQSGAFQTSDSGYSASGECPARGPSVPFAEHLDPVPQEHESTCATAVQVSNTVPKHSVDIDEEHELQGVVGSADMTENMEMQTISDSFDASTAKPPGINSPMDEARTALIEESHGDIIDHPSGEMDPRLLSLAPLGATDWASYNFDDHALDDFIVRTPPESRN
ncbi:hypothetical protein SLS60_010474 [Paraconiothyrium brasiliense]|uniref:Protein kinase domain-containing protein n=1 Tax=Paraconiothyrium brasiliense TaxID=300254 RepID=A0ABR3QPL0_9PLEO